MFRRIPRLVSSRGGCSSVKLIETQQRRRHLIHHSQYATLSTWTTRTTTTPMGRNTSYNSTTIFQHDTSSSSLHNSSHHSYYYCHAHYQQQRRWHSSSKLKQTSAATTAASDPDLLDNFNDYIDNDEEDNVGDDDDDDHNEEEMIYEEDLDRRDHSDNEEHSTNENKQSHKNMKKKKKRNKKNQKETLVEFTNRRKEQARAIAQLLLHHVDAQDFKYWRTKLKSASRRKFETTLDSMEIISTQLSTRSISIQDAVKERLEYVFLPLTSSSSSSNNTDTHDNKSTKSKKTPVGKPPPLWVQDLLVQFLEDKLPSDISIQSYYQMKLKESQQNEQKKTSSQISIPSTTIEGDPKDDDEDGKKLQQLVSLQQQQVQNQNYGPIVNRFQFEQNVQTLVQFQEFVATQYPIFINFKARTEMKQTYVTKAAAAAATSNDNNDEDSTPKKKKKSNALTQKQFFTMLQEDLSSKHALKSFDECVQEATEIAHVLADRLAPEAHSRLFQYMQDLMVSHSKDVTMKKNSKQQLLVGQLEQLIGESSILVIMELAKFLYALDDINDLTGDQEKHDADTRIGSNDADNEMSSHQYPPLLKEIHLPEQIHDSRLTAMLKQRITMEDQFVDSLVRMANTNLFNILEIRKTFSKARSGDGASVEDEEAYEEMLELLENTTLTKKHRGKNKSKKEKYATHNSMRNRLHVTFDAIELQWDESNVANNLKTPLPSATTASLKGEEEEEQPVIVEPPAERPPDRTIFLDNLPIDIEEMELIDLYSRCGPIASIQVFNKREEYDPGPLSAKQKRALVKRKKHTYLGRQGKYVRPRSPVYAIITYADEDGFKKAVDPTLSVFGKVIRRHAVLSKPCTKMTTLYIEEIPNGYYSIDIEQKLSNLLHPNFYVCLDKGVGNKSAGISEEDDQDDQPGSCAIKFPNFEMAHQAYWKLQELREEHQKNMNDVDESNDTNVPTKTTRAWSIQWMKTPPDAMEYWKRESILDRR